MLIILCFKIFHSSRTANVLSGFWYDKWSMSKTATWIYCTVVRISTTVFAAGIRTSNIRIVASSQPNQKRRYFIPQQQLSPHLRPKLPFSMPCTQGGWKYAIFSLILFLRFSRKWNQIKRIQHLSKVCTVQAQHFLIFCEMVTDKNDPNKTLKKLLTHWRLFC